VTAITQCTVAQRQLHLVVDQAINDGYLVFDPQPVTDSPALVASLSDEQAVHASSAAADDSATTGGDGVQAAASHPGTANFDVDHRRAMDGGAHQSFPVMVAENCAWTISAKPGRTVLAFVIDACMAG
jgi:hypothetical protein